MGSIKQYLTSYGTIALVNQIIISSCRLVVFAAGDYRAFQVWQLSVLVYYLLGGPVFVLGGEKLRHFKQISTLQYLLSIFHTKIVFKQHTDVKKNSGNVIQPSTNIYCVVEFFLFKMNWKYIFMSNDKQCYIIYNFLQSLILNYVLV